MNPQHVAIAINIVTGVLGYLAVRWIAGQIRIAILELENRLGDKYATKEDVQRVEDQVKLVERIDEVGSNVRRYMRPRRDDQSPEPT